jgi:putative membrane protein
VDGLTGEAGPADRSDGPAEVRSDGPSGVRSDRPAESPAPPERAEPAERGEPSEPSVPHRRPLSVYGHGEEPDPRFSLANERTALAWMRTALALVGGGVALISVGSLATLPKWSALIGAAVCVGGALLAWRAVTGWARVERALRHSQRLPAPRALAWLAGGVIVLAMLTLVLTLLQLLRR